MKKKAKKKIKVIAFLLLILYTALMIYFLFFSESLGRTPSYDYHYNFTPMAEIMRVIKNKSRLGPGYVLLNLLGNIICFIPYGFFVPILIKKVRKPLTMLAVIFFTTLIVELAQFFTKLGVFDIDDIILNFLGGVIGYTIFAFVHTGYKRSRKKKKRRV